nr:hypothetical protein Itr_chr03CG05770 [Ipomoea trifida]
MAAATERAGWRGWATTRLLCDGDRSTATGLEASCWTTRRRGWREARRWTATGLDARRWTTKESSGRDRRRVALAGVATSEDRRWSLKMRRWCLEFEDAAMVILHIQI